MLNSTLIDLTHAQIEQAVRSSDAFGGTPSHPVAGTMRDQFSGYEDNHFEATVMDVWTALSDGPLRETHWLVVHFTWEPEGTTSGAQVEVLLPHHGTVAGTWRELRHLTRGHETTGIDGLIDIAEVLIDAANESLTLARPLIEAQRAGADAVDSPLRRSVFTVDVLWDSDQYPPEVDWTDLTFLAAEKHVGGVFAAARSVREQSVSRSHMGDLLTAQGRSPDVLGALCRFPDCDEDPDDGEGWDGWCGHHADTIEAHLSVDCNHDPATRGDCAVCTGHVDPPEVED